MKYGEHNRLPESCAFCLRRKPTGRLNNYRICAHCKKTVESIAGRSLSATEFKPLPKKARAA